MYGREARLPVDLQFGLTSANTFSSHTYTQQLQSTLDNAYQMVRKTLGDVQARQKTLYDCKVHGKPYEEGDLVWLFSPVIPKGSHHKFHHPWTGPYKVISKLSDVNYRIQLHSSSTSISTIVHFDRLKICTPGTRFDTKSTQAPTCTDHPTHHDGDGADLVDMDDGVVLPTNLPGSSRYPSRQRRPPDRLEY